MGTLSGLFAPDRVAVVGATDRSGSVGRAIMRNLQSGFDGTVLPVNPGRETVFSRPALDSVSETDADLAVVVVPPDAVVPVVREAGEAGIRSAVVVTAGFGEAGSDGAARESELIEVATEHGIDLVGPNSLGIMSTPVGMNATFGPEDATPGGLSFMSQSGAFITAVLDWANEQGLGFRDVVSLGNKAVLDESDFVEAWGGDNGTEVILGYLEGISDGEAFIRAAREVTPETPVVVVKSGRTDAGAQAASSHTGTIAGSEQAYEAGLDQAGVIRADSVQELFDAARVLEGQPLPDRDTVAVVTNAGGPGVMTTDAVGDSGLSMASLTDDTLESLSASLPAEGNIYNPVDVVGDADNDRFRSAIDVVLGDDAVGSVIVLACPTAVLDYDQLARDTVDLQTEHGKPVAACLMGGARVDRAEDALSAAGIPNYFDPARAVYGLDTLAEYRSIAEREYEAPVAFDVDRERAEEMLSSAVDRDNTRLGVEAMGLLDAYGIPTPYGEVVDTPGAAADVAARIDGHVVMKVVSPDILHKSDVGGVEVGVADAEVPDTYADLVARARRYQPDATILGVQVQEMVDLDDGVETIVGMNRDPQFGPLVLFGLGGIFVETLEDTTSRVAPVSRPEAEAMTREIDAAPLLRGARGRDPVDVDATVETIQRLSQLVTDVPAILELDINPLVATPSGVAAVDVRLTIDPDRL
ncbi:acetyl-CoA synthetase [Halobellus salinus]|uniref:acetate--CoA ligase (ADP-forming) n=1 Tax=Halobellus salinus TaxID=931585 RepID=A0A830EDX5_9EURY|nr:acetate--CoA ligase family protein [Halobellus salinus]GGJ16205.1 acetyl-CoA synthetase [Halobellus salinus]SMP30514.1 acetyltransferase [Halobellus salinus]